MRGYLRKVQIKILIDLLDELRQVQRREEKSEDIKNDLEIKKEQDEWDNLIIFKNKVKELHEIEKLVFFEQLLAQKEITNLVELAGWSRRTLQKVKKFLLLKLKNALKN